MLPTAGTYFARVRAKSPALTIDRYILMATLNGFAPQNEVEPNDTIPFQPSGAAPVLGTLSSAADVDLYKGNVLDHGIPFVVVDGDPERDGTGTNVVLRFDNLFPLGTITTDSSGVGFPGNPPAEGFAITGLGTVRVTGTGPGSYLLGVFYSGEQCPVPVELQGLEVR